MTKFYDIEHGVILDLADLLTEYDTLKAENSTEAANFGDYLQNCLTRNGGTLEVVI